eukprot:SAG31_NODE_4560_length_3137_cov_7.770244_1_plen_28_part_10
MLRDRRAAAGAECMAARGGGGGPSPGWL